MLKNIFKKVLQQKAFSKISILIIICAIILSVVIILYRGYTYQGPERLSANWPTYRSEEYGFEVKYPPGWVAIEMAEVSGARQGLLAVIFAEEYFVVEDDPARGAIVIVSDEPSFGSPVFKTEDCPIETMPFKEIQAGAENYPAKKIDIGPDDPCFEPSNYILFPRSISDANLGLVYLTAPFVRRVRGGPFELIQDFVSPGLNYKFEQMLSTFKFLPLEAAPRDASNIEIIPKVIQETKTAPAEVTYQVDVSYPELQGLSSSVVQDHVNNAIASQISALIAEFKQSAAESMAYQGQPGRNLLEINYTVEFLNDNFLNVLYFKTSDALGAAHPYSGVFVFNYDLSGDKLFGLKDIFLADANYLETISELVIADLISQDISDEAWIRRGAGLEEENFQNFVLSDSGLTFYFNPYQVASYFSGLHSATLPFQDLTDILSPVFLEKFQ